MSVNPIISRSIFRADARLLFDPVTGVEHALNESASWVVAELRQGKTVDAVAAAIARSCDVPPEEVRADITNLLTTLETKPDDVAFGDFERGFDATPAFPFALEVELSRFCNWNCVFCYNVWKGRHGTSGMSRAPHFNTQRLCDILEECAQSGLFRVRYSGGEPTFHPDFDTILRFGAGLGLYQVIFTNGRTLTHDTASKWADCNVREVLISLHGPADVHDWLAARKGAFTTACAAIANAVEAGLTVVAEMALTAINEKYVCETIDITRSLGVRQFRIMRYVATGRADATLSVDSDITRRLMEVFASDPRWDDMHIRFPCSQRHCFSEAPKTLHDGVELERLQRYLVPHCRAGINWVSLSVDGRLRVCPHSDVALADMSAPNTSIRAAWLESVRPKVLSVFDAQRNACGGCDALPICGGGCHLPHFMASAGQSASCDA